MKTLEELQQELAFKQDLLSKAHQEAQRIHSLEMRAKRIAEDLSGLQDTHDSDTLLQSL